MEAIFENPIIVTSSIKRMLIDQYIKREGLTSASKCIPELNIQTPLKSSEKYQMPRSTSTTSFLNSKISAQQFSTRSRPSSVCSSRSNLLVPSQYFDSDISIEFLGIIKAITIKKVQILHKMPKDENLLCLVYSFLVILVEAGEDFGFTLNKKLMRSFVWPSFTSITSKPGTFIKAIRKIPNLIRNKRIPEAEVKKSLALFNMVDPKRIGQFKIIYDLLKETLAYIGEVYNINITVKSILSSKNTNNKPKNSSSNVKTHRSSSMIITEPDNPSGNTLVEKVVNLSELKQTKRSCASLDMDFGENTKESQSKIISTTQDILLKELLKKPLSLFKANTSPINKSRKNSKQLKKNQQFLVDSRISRRLHEKFTEFLSEVKKFDNVAGGSMEEKTQIIMDQFIKSLPCSDISSSTLKYLEYLSATKEFVKLLHSL